MKSVNMQVLGGSSPWTGPSAPGCGDRSKASASFGSISGGDEGNLAPDANLEQHVSSDMLRLRRSPAESERLVVRKDQLHY